MSSPGQGKGKKRKPKGRGKAGRGRGQDVPQLSTPGRSEAAAKPHLDETEGLNEENPGAEGGASVPEEKAPSFEAEEKPAATTSRSASKAKSSASSKADEKRQGSSAISKTKTSSTSSAEDNTVVSCPAAETKQTATSVKERETPELSHPTASKTKTPSTGNPKQQLPVTKGILKKNSDMLHAIMPLISDSIGVFY